jgi:ubiquinone/menaquinone biosynthesis C-methylase UbiE
VRGTAVEIGCGAGRMTRCLAGHFDRVVALDVSPDMVRRADAATPDNVEFHVVDEALIPLPDASVDAVFSVHVLQHLDTFEMVRSYLAEAARVLRPGGTMMVHVTLADRPRSFWNRVKVEYGIWRSRRGLRKGRQHSLVRMHLYTYRQILRVLRDLGFTGIELRMFEVRSIPYQHHFWLARRPAETGTSAS